MDGLTCWLNERKAAGNLRELMPIQRIPGGRIRLPGMPESLPPLLDFSSNDYLALTLHQSVIENSRRFLDSFGAGSGAARLMSGDLEIHHHLEAEVARFKGKESALLFGAGYLANTGVIPALAGRGDVIFSDRLNHASIYDGCLLSGARLIRFRHNNLNHLEECLEKHRGNFQQALVVVESIYSMDGDRCPLKRLIELKSCYSFILMVDEAHATGVFGRSGGGVIEEDGVADHVDISMGTFGKALGSYGSYVAASEEMVRYLVNRARTFIYSTALPPAVIGASLAAISVVREDRKMRSALHKKATLFKKILQQAGLNQDFGPSQIVPLLVRDSNVALELAADLRKKGIFATPVRPPTVPRGTARLRFSVTLHHSDQVIIDTADVVAEAYNRLMLEKN